MTVSDHILFCSFLPFWILLQREEVNGKHISLQVRKEQEGSCQGVVAFYTLPQDERW